MLRTSICGTFVFTLFSIALFCLSAVFGRPTPPVQGTEALGQYVAQVVDHSDEDLYAALQQPWPHAPSRAPSAFGAHPPLANPILQHHGYNMPPYGQTAPTYLAYPRAGLNPGFHYGAIATDSTSVSIVPPVAQLAHDTSSLPNPIYEGIPIGVRTGPSLYGPTYHAPIYPSFYHQPPQEPLRGGMHSTLHAFPMQGNRAVPTEAAAGPSRPLESAGASDLAWLRGSRSLLYRTVLQHDPAIDAFIAALKNKMAFFEQDAVHDPNPVQLTHKYIENPDLLTVNTFWHRALAKELFMPTSSGLARLLITHDRKPSVLSNLEGSGFVGVWQMGPPQAESLSSLFFHGFYPFKEESYRRLASQPQAGRDYWITVRRRKVVSISGLSVMIEPKYSEETQELASWKQQGGDSDRNALLQAHIGPSGQTEAVVSHIYLYEGNPEVVHQLRRWGSLANIPANAFLPIHLDLEQQVRLNARMEQAFRLRRHVKIVTFENGAIWMLCHHQNLKWLQPGTREVMTVWKFGHTEKSDDGSIKRIMIAIGFFQASKNAYRKLAPGVIPGLRDTQFQYNSLDVP
ncbi:uncharacterized protein SPSC_03534 [Sporisorium scitamineum]|uniref:Effector family protein Eff1 n=1 Tax=Sporisorium scitamineum TaxID=49012 RepID=A0A140KN43_9BASI|nr:uncharacterized protein SPSC_03534 [Sporisorium scitamineum]